MRVALLVVAVGLLAGCASSRPANRPPGSLPTPTTLAEVNSVLAVTRATVHYVDGRSSERAFAQVSPDVTVLRASARYDEESRQVPTDDVASIEIDDSQTAGQGAWRGLKYGTLPGATAMGAGLAISVVDERPKGCFWICLSAGEVLFAYGVLATGAGAIIGPPVGALSTARRYPVVVYASPVSQYPDATPAQTALPNSPIFRPRAGD